MHIVLDPPSEQTLKVQKIFSQVTRILKASQNLQSVGSHIDQLPALDNMAERRSGDVL
jgi:hypothetical protein